MRVNKITIGFVTQVFDTELKRFVRQEFMAGDDVAYENGKGDAVDSDLVADKDGGEAYLPFDMVQPEADDHAAVVERLSEQGGIRRLAAQGPGRNGPRPGIQHRLQRQQQRRGRADQVSHQGDGSPAYGAATRQVDCGTTRERGIAGSTAFRSSYQGDNTHERHYRQNRRPALPQPALLLMKIADSAQQKQPYLPAANDSDLLEGLINLTDDIADEAHDDHGIDCLLEEDEDGE